MERFSKQSFVALSESDREARCGELAKMFTARMKGPADFHGRVRTVVSELRSLGHDLWSFDESDDMEAWGPNYATPSGPGLVVTFYPDEVVVEWSKQ